MTDTATHDATSRAMTSIAAPVRAAGDTAAAALGSVIDAAADRGRKARRRAAKRARAEIGHQQRVVRKQAKDAKKKSHKAWADFAEETAARATNIVEASKGGRVTRHSKTRRATAVLAVAIAVGIVVVRSAQVRSTQATKPTTENAGAEPATTERIPS